MNAFRKLIKDLRPKPMKRQSVIIKNQPQMKPTTRKQFIHATDGRNELTVTSLAAAAKLTGQPYDALKYLKFPFSVNGWTYSKTTKS